MENRPLSSKTQDQTVTPSGGLGGKEAEKKAVKEEIAKVIEEERGKEEKRVVVGEIRSPEVPEIPPELEELGVKPVSLPPLELEEETSGITEIALPFTKEEVRSGLQKSVMDAMRWLATLIRRLLEKTGGKFRYVLQGLKPKSVPT